RELARVALITLTLSGKEQTAERHLIRARALTAFQSLLAEDQQILVRRFLDLGESLRIAGRNPEAERAYTLAIELKPDDPSAWFQRAHAYTEPKHFEKALADFSRAIALQPAEAMYRSNRGNAYAELGQWEKAAADFAKVTELKVDDPLAWYRLALVRLQQGDR